MISLAKKKTNTGYILRLFSNNTNAMVWISWSTWCIGWVGSVKRVTLVQLDCFRFRLDERRLQMCRDNPLLQEGIYVYVYDCRLLCTISCSGSLHNRLINIRYMKFYSTPSLCREKVEKFHKCCFWKEFFKRNCFIQVLSRVKWGNV